MDAFDLNIDNYTIDELEDFFMLGRSAGVPIYDTGNVDQKRSMLLNKLTGDPSLPHSLKIGIKTFLEQAGQRIVGYINGANSSVSGGRISAMYNPYSAVAPLSNTQSPQAGSAAFTGLQNTVVQQGSHFLIQNPSAMNQQQQQQQHSSSLTQQSSIQAGSTEFQGSGTGVVNPIQRRTIKRALNIDTRFRPNYNSTKSTDIQISLPYRFEKVIGLRVAAVEMPLTYYAISADNGNNVFRVNWVDNVTDPASPVTRADVITVPDGNYETVFTSTSDTRNTTIESAINALLKETPHGNAPLYLRFTVDRTSGRSIFAQDISGAAYAIPFTITFNVDQSGRTVEQAALPLYLGWSLGFRGAVYNRGGTTSASTQTTSTAIISEGTCCIHGPQYAFIAIDDYNNSVNNYFISAYKDSVASPNVVARLNLTQIQQCGQVYQMGQDDGVSNQMDFRSRTYFGPVDIQKMRVTVFDEFGRIINLNNMDWSMAILFECMYE
jgi:hypothetical protein